MAKVIGPLFSQEARGQIGKTIVFNRRRGQNIARGYVIPANPMTDAQVIVRISLAVVGIINRRIRATDWRFPTVTETIIEFANGRLRVGEVWPSALARLSLGSGRAFYLAAVAQYAALDGAIVTDWEDAATGAIPGLEGYTRGSDTITPGFMLFLNQRMLAANGYGVAFTPDVPIIVVTGS